MATLKENQEVSNLYDVFRIAVLNDRVPTSEFIRCEKLLETHKRPTGAFQKLYTYAFLHKYSHAHLYI